VHSRHRGVSGVREVRSDPWRGRAVVKQNDKQAADRERPAHRFRSTRCACRPGRRQRVGSRQRQIEEDTYCIDVLQQIAAVNGALQNVAIGLLDEHVGHCVANAAAAGDQNKARDMVTEATRAIAGII
jgi:CsoR family transcriptional regulator, copper-sensing transcriptional repressor